MSEDDDYKETTVEGVETIEAARVKLVKRELNCTLVDTGTLSTCPRCGSIARVYAVQGGMWAGYECRVWRAPDGGALRPERFTAAPNLVWMDITWPHEWREGSDGCGYDSVAWKARWSAVP